METFKPVLGYKGLYEISDHGNIRGLIHNRLLKPGTGTSGYRYVMLSKNGKETPKQIHRLVLESFVGKPSEKMEANHKNGIKTDNRLENLEWMTRSENILHRVRTLGIKPHICRGIEHGNAFFTESAVRAIRKAYSEGESYGRIAKNIGCSKSAICHIVKRRSWAHVY